MTLGVPFPLVRPATGLFLPSFLLDRSVCLLGPLRLPVGSQAAIQPCWPFRGCILCAVVIKVAASLMTPVVAISCLLTTNQSCCLAVDSWHLSCCIDLSWLYPFYIFLSFLQRTVAGKCSGIFLPTPRCQLNLSLVTAWLPAEIHFAQPDTKPCSLEVRCATSQLPRWKQKRDTTMLAFSWLCPSCLPLAKLMPCS